jgi:hypothetical protein
MTEQLDLVHQTSEWCLASIAINSLNTAYG